MPDSLFTLSSLATLPGAAWATYLIVAYTKRFADRIMPKIIGTDMYAVFVGFIVLLSSSWKIHDQVTVETVMWALINGFLVAAVSGKLADKSKEPKVTRDDY
jgi:uncharacterized YccA/Bax inhibitor family protein